MMYQRRKKSVRAKKVDQWKTGLKIFAHKETHLRQAKEKRKKYCAMTFKFHSIEYLFDSYFYKQTKKKMTANEEELSIAVQIFVVIFEKRSQDFHRKDVRQQLRKHQDGFHSFSSPRSFSFHFFLFSRLLFLLKITRTTARR